MLLSCNSLLCYEIIIKMGLLAARMHTLVQVLGLETTVLGQIESNRLVYFTAKLKPVIFSTMVVAFLEKGCYIFHICLTAGGGFHLQDKAP